MRFDFIAAQKAHHSVNLLCRLLQVSRSGFYAWQHRPPAVRLSRDRLLATKICVLHAQSKGRYGSPRICRDLWSTGERVSRKRVARLMREHSLAGRRKRRFKKTTDSQHAFPLAKNLLNRDFQPAARDQVWAGDVTYVRTWEGWLYLAVVIDLYSRRVVGFAMADHMRTELVLDALRQAVTLRRPSPGLMHHSDRGSQYASANYQEFLAKQGIVASMSRKGNCWDNAVVESFFSTLKEELIYRAAWPTAAAARQAITDYIVDFYNARRRHSALDYLSPQQYEGSVVRKLRAA